MDSRFEKMYRIPCAEKVVCEYEYTFEEYFNKLKDLYYLPEQRDILDAIQTVYPLVMRAVLRSEAHDNSALLSSKEMNTIEEVAKKALETTKHQPVLFKIRLYQNENVMNDFTTPEERKGLQDLEEAEYSWNQIINIITKNNLVRYDTHGVRYIDRLQQHVYQVIDSLPYFGIQPKVCSYIPLAYRQEAYHSLFSQQDTL